VKTRCQNVPTWLLVEILRRADAFGDEQNVMGALSWLKFISKPLKLVNIAAAVREANTEPPSKKAKREDDCWAHDFLSKDQTRRWLNENKEYPFICPICSKDKVLLQFWECLERQKHLRPLAPLFPLKIEFITGTLEVFRHDDPPTGAGESPAVWHCKFEPSLSLDVPITRVAIETSTALYRGAFGGRLVQGISNGTSAANSVMIKLSW